MLPFKYFKAKSTAKPISIIALSAGIPAEKRIEKSRKIFSDKRQKPAPFDKQNMVLSLHRSDLLASSDTAGTFEGKRGLADGSS